MTKDSNMHQSTFTFACTYLYLFSSSSTALLKGRVWKQLHTASHRQHYYIQLATATQLLHQNERTKLIGPAN